MYWDLNNKPLVQWVYPTEVRRVRKIDNTTVYESFIGTDFTYSDIGIADAAGEHKLLGEEEYNNKKVYKVETIPKQKWYYSRIVSLIASDTFLPIKRDYYDNKGRHWKTKLFENVTVINNVPIPLRIRMLDAQRKSYSTEAIFSEICHDVAFLTKEDFDPTKLSEAALSPVCSVRPFKQKEEPGS